MRVSTSNLTLIFTFILILHEIRAAWPQFRRPSGNGRIGKMSQPLEWSAEKNVAGSQAMPGGPPQFSQEIDLRHGNGGSKQY